MDILENSQAEGGLTSMSGVGYDMPDEDSLSIMS